MDRRTTEARKLLKDMTEVSQKASMAPKNDAAISLFEPRCRVCSAGSAMKNLPNGKAVRGLVDSMLLLPASYRETLKAIEPLMQDWPEQQRVSYDSIGHIKASTSDSRGGLLARSLSGARRRRAWTCRKGARDS